MRLVKTAKITTRLGFNPGRELGPRETRALPKLPAAATSAVWKHKGIYRFHDEQVGQWSDVLSVSVMG